MKNQLHPIPVLVAKLPSGVSVGIIGLMILLSSVVQGQVINFDAPGGVSGGVNYSGSGAAPDTGIYWNPVKPKGTTPAGTNSDGVVVSAITLTDTSPSSYSPAQGGQGTVAGLEAPFLLENTGSTITETLSNVPAGTYNLYLYGKNSNDSGNGNRGTTFTASVGGTAYGTQSTANSISAAFTQGNDYVMFTNMLVGAAGKIAFTYTANAAAPGTPNNNEGDFNGLQLAKVILTPGIIVQPSAVSAITGDAAQLVATVTGAPPFYYQWQKGTNGIYVNSVDTGNVTGSGTNVLNFSALTLGDAADYQLIVTNTYGAATGQVVTVSVLLRAPVGATTPFTSYEAEAGLLGGGATIYYLTNAPTSQYSSAVLEASGHAYVALTGTGQYVQWTNNTGHNLTAINLRSCIPDAPAGGGISNTIDLYVNGVFRQAFSVNSLQNYCYEATNYNGQTDKNPADGDPRGFWNDTHAFVAGAAVAPGDTIKFQMDSSNTASFYDLDVVDLEKPPMPLTPPANSISILSYGAVSNNVGVDNTAAINNCFSAARSQGKIAWIPPGIYCISAVHGGLNASGITIQGAGPWYSTIYRVTPANNNQGVANIITTVSCTLQDVSLDCNGSNRDGANNNGAVDFSGTNWLVNDVWIQHATSAFWCAGLNGTAKNCRVLSLWSDGGNFNNIQSDNGVGNNLTYMNNFVRGTGDDGMAINGTDASGFTPMNNIAYVDNTAVATWGGGGISVYAGHNITVTNNLITDSPRYVGLRVGYFSQAGSISNVLVQGNVLLRCGGNGYNDMSSAIEVGTDNTNFNDRAITFVGNIISDSIYGGMLMKDCTNCVFRGNAIVRPATYGITVEPTALGAGEFDDNAVSDLKVGQPMFYNSSSTYVVSTTNVLVRPPVEAASYNNVMSASAYRETCSEGGQDLCNIYNGDYVVYQGVNLSGVSNFVARVASGGAGGNIEIHLDSPAGTLVGACAVPATGGWQTWTTKLIAISGASGNHDVYLVFTGGNAVLFNVEWFALLGAGNRLVAASYNNSSGMQTESCVEGGLDVTNISNGSYAVYNQLNLTGATSFFARVASASSGGNIQIRLDSTNGVLIGTCPVTATGGWQTWATVSCALNASAAGCHDVYLVFTGGGGTLFNLEWLQFQFNSLSASPSDLALNRPVTASSSADGTVPASAVDGNLNTRWGSAYSDPQWIYVDLGAVYNITAVTLAWENASAKAYQIQVSTNLTAWATIYSENNGPGGTESLTGLAGMGRYVRMYGTARNTSYGYSLWEFDVFGSTAQSSASIAPPPLSVQSVSTHQNIALQWSDNGARELPQQPSVYYAPGLTAPVTWTLTTNAPTYINGQWLVNLPATNSQGFYRLR